jgi:hypothetical protein
MGLGLRLDQVFEFGRGDIDTPGGGEEARQFHHRCRGLGLGRDQAPVLRLGLVQLLVLHVEVGEQVTVFGAVGKERHQLAQHGFGPFRKAKLLQGLDLEHLQ